jgi:hypothetical protein
MSLSSSLAHADWQGRKINLIDAPGDAGFQGGTPRCVRSRARSRSRCDGRRGRHGPRLHAPRTTLVGSSSSTCSTARAPLPRARGAPLAALRPLRRRAHPDHAEHEPPDRRCSTCAYEPRGQRRRRPHRDPAEMATGRPSTGESC